MEVISLKLDEGMLKRIDKIVKENNYGTRTEFIRSSLREKMSQLEKDELIKKIMVLKGSVKTRTTEEEYKRLKDEAWKDYAKEHGLK
jgi:metal-responsive CopG/Arc/MetJ family transcriptional regulator